MYSLYSLDALVAPGAGPGPAHHVGDQHHDHHPGQGAAHDDRHHVTGPVAAVHRGLEQNRFTQCFAMYTCTAEYLEHALGDVNGPEGVKPDVRGGERGVGKLLPGIIFGFWKINEYKIVSRTKYFVLLHR